LIRFFIFHIWLILKIEIVIIYRFILLIFIIWIVCMLRIFRKFRFIFYLNLVEFITRKNQSINSLFFSNIWENAIYFFLNFYLLLFIRVRIIAINNIWFVTLEIIDFRSYFRSRFKPFLFQYLVLFVLFAHNIRESLIWLPITFFFFFLIVFLLLPITFYVLKVWLLLSEKLSFIIWIITF